MSPSWSPLRPVSGFLEEGAKAPVPVPAESGNTYRDTLERLLAGIVIPRGALQTAVATGSILLLGAQNTLSMANSLARGEPSAHEVQQIVQKMLRCFLVLLKERPTAYVLHQVAEIAEAQLGPPPGDIELVRVNRLKDFMSPLETCLGRLGVERRMEAPRFAALLVHLDDLYDDASVQLQRLFLLAGRELPEARILAPDFLRRLYSDFVRASLADHLLSEPPGGEDRDVDRGTGLIALLPELVEVLE